MIRLVFLSTTVFLFSCSTKESIKPVTEILEVYSTIDNGEGYVKGDMKHYDSKHYSKGLHKETLFYKADGELKGKEVFIYEGSESTPSGSEYYDSYNNLLSHYKFTYDEEGNKTRSQAYEGESDDLLRIETFLYDNGNRITKEIRDNNNVIQRSFHFIFDAYGNEIEMKVIEGDGNIIATEKYEITEIYPDNTWREKWGFVNDVPTTYQVLKK